MILLDFEFVILIPIPWAKSRSRSSSKSKPGWRWPPSCPYLRTRLDCEAGKVGGTGSDVHSIGLGESKGLCTQKPPQKYPQMAREMGIDGIVRVRLLISTKGEIIKKKDPLCKSWFDLDRKERRQKRKFWHPGLCIEATSGPDTLLFDALSAWGTSGWRPYRRLGVDTNYYANVELNSKLR